MKSTFQITLWLACLIVLTPMHAFGQTPHDLIRGSLVFIKATGEKTTNSNSAHTAGTSNKVDGTGTGFLVTNDGLILTSDDLLENLISQGADPSKIRYSIAIREKVADLRPALVFDQSQALDLMLLKVAPGADMWDPVSLGSAVNHDDGTKIFSSGFPETTSYRKLSADGISAREGVKPHFYDVDGLGLLPGMGGAPVYNTEGEVIGIVKQRQTGGVDTMIPIDFADPLIAQVRLRELQSDLKTVLSIIQHDEHGPVVLGERLNSIESNLKHLRGHFTWRFDQRRAILRYEKLVAGEPHVIYVDVKMTLYDPVYKKGSRLGKLGAKPRPVIAEQRLSRRIDIDDVVAEFDMTPIINGIKSRMASEEIASATDLYLEIVPSIKTQNDIQPLSAVRLLRPVSSEIFFSE